MTNVMEFDENEPTVVPVVIASETADAPHIDVGSATETEISSGTSQELLEWLLAKAQRHRKEGNIPQAKELFWRLVFEHSETPQADTARAELSALAEGFASAAASQPMLERLLAMAQRYRKEGSDRQATEMFWSLVEEHSETLQADAAKAELLALAEGYERAGSQHMARSMYERLLDLED